jgi:hypothetical protein
MPAGAHGDVPDGAATAVTDGAGGFSAAGSVVAGSVVAGSVAAGTAAAAEGGALAHALP